MRTSWPWEVAEIPTGTAATVLHGSRVVDGL